MESGLADSDDESAIEHLTLPRQDPVPVSRGGRGRKLKFLNQVNAEDLAMALKVPALEPSQKSKSEPKQKAQSSEEKSESLNVFGPIAHMPTVGSDLQHRYCQVVSNALQNGIDYEDSLIESMFSHTHSSASSIAKFNECSLIRVSRLTAVIECGCAAVYGGGWFDRVTMLLYWENDFLKALGGLLLFFDAHATTKLQQRFACQKKLVPAEVIRLLRPQTWSSTQRFFKQNSK